MSHATANVPTHDHQSTNVVNRLITGAIAGVVSGAIFAMAAMIYAVISGPGFWAPLRMIATTLGFDMGTDFAFGAVIVGLILHMMLSAMYGVGFAVIFGGLRRGSAALVGGGFGLALYIVNFEGFAHLSRFSAFRMMAGNWFEIVDHIMFGMILGALVVGMLSRSRRI